MADTSVALSLLKASLGYFGSVLDSAVETYLNQLLQVASTQLAERGIDLTDGDVCDAQLQAMYAAWLYRKNKTGEAKPAMLKCEIRDRQVQKALKTEEGS